ncbi:MAG: histidinol-phosphatase [Tannerella sp.]|nr:histidinol-phosphatase [Tannerella sp.]
MKNKANFHTHCNFCDGRNPAEDFVKAAIAENFRACGFSSHSPLPFETFWNMPACKMPAYLNEIKRLKTLYAADIEIYASLEIDYLDESYNASIPPLQTLPLDYRISSIHFMPWQLPHKEENMICIDGEYDAFELSVNRHYGGNIKTAVQKYFDNSMKMVAAGGFDIVGHIDKIYMNARRHKDFDMNASWYRNPFLELLDLIAEKELIVEINTKNKIKKGHTYPHVNSYRDLCKRKISVMINSDAHSTDLIYEGINETIPLLQEAGFRSTRELVKGKWEEIELKNIQTITT